MRNEVEPSAAFFGSLISFTFAQSSRRLSLTHGAHAFFAVSTKDARRSVFNLDTFADTPLLVAVGAALATIVLTTTFGPFQRLLQTGPLELEQWLVCLAAALVVPVVSEVRKLFVRRSSPITPGG